MEDEPRAAQLEHWDRVGPSYASGWGPPARLSQGTRARLGHELGTAGLAVLAGR